MLSTRITDINTYNGYYGIRDRLSKISIFGSDDKRQIMCDGLTESSAVKVSASGSLRANASLGSLECNEWQVGLVTEFIKLA